MTDHMPPEPVENEPVKPKPDKPKKLSLFLMWCYGLKVCVMFGVIVMLAYMPLGVVNGLIHEFLSEERMVRNQPPEDTVLGVIIYGAVALFITPYLVGWMYYNAREWFEVDHPDESVEEVFRPKV